MAVTAQQAANALRQYRAAVPVAITRGMRAGLRRAEGFAKTRYMVRKDNRHPSKVWDPPNPEPGPLAIRQGNLARTVRITDIKIEKNAVIGGLAAGNSVVKYARIHELGGRAGRQLRSLIPARPYLTPALEDPQTRILESVQAELRKLAAAVLRGVAKGA